MLKISQVRWFQRQISLTSPPERLGMRRLRISNNCYRFSLHIALTGPSCHLLVKNATLKSTRDAELRSANIQLVNCHILAMLTDTNQLLVDPKMFISGIQPRHNNASPSKSVWSPFDRQGILIYELKSGPRNSSKSQSSRFLKTTLLYLPTIKCFQMPLFFKKSL